jgi:hypothetical protein
MLVSSAREFLIVPSRRRMARPPLMVSLVPHSEQNFAPGALPWPHEEQRDGSAAPHWLQNLLPSGTSARQLGPSMPHLRTFGSGAAHHSIGRNRPIVDEEALDQILLGREFTLRRGL